MPGSPTSLLRSEACTRSERGLTALPCHEETHSPGVPSSFSLPGDPPQSPAQPATAFETGRLDKGEGAASPSKASPGNFAGEHRPTTPSLEPLAADIEELSPLQPTAQSGLPGLRSPRVAAGLHRLREAMLQGGDGSESPEGKSAADWPYGVHTLEAEGSGNRHSGRTVRLKSPRWNNCEHEEAILERRQSSVLKRKDEAWDEAQYLRLIISANDIKTAVEEERLDEITSLELIMERPVPLSLFAQFSNLQELVLVSQGLSSLKEIGSCHLLRKLIVTENKITSLEGRETPSPRGAPVFRTAGVQASDGPSRCLNARRWVNERKR
ncbi:leucine rich repeat-containing protein [Cystoisospora suis]|uniref:Leucine rich repeat-containing protein n=1 Tax=Cystoisospora suis TaxID=483139 RepID=A0A2C6L678_9APIC|nr:leucine rich repeat-containing protein [Cystoisospora suis]